MLSPLLLFGGKRMCIITCKHLPRMNSVVNKICARVTDVCSMGAYRRSAQDMCKGSQGVVVFLSVCLQDLVESLTTNENEDEWQHISCNTPLACSISASFSSAITTIWCSSSSSSGCSLGVLFVCCLCSCFCGCLCSCFCSLLICFGG